MRINWNLYELLADRLPAAIGGVHCSNLLNHRLDGDDEGSL